MPLRTVRSRSELVSPQGLDGPRYAWARRYLREVHEPQGSATPCLESEGQCFVEPVDARPAKE
jgi:hypothetical protein